jgi:hypothetical protein
MGCVNIIVRFTRIPFLVEFEIENNVKKMQQVTPTGFLKNFCALRARTGRSDGADDREYDNFIHFRCGVNMPTNFVRNSSPIGAVSLRNANENSPILCRSGRFDYGFSTSNHAGNPGIRIENFVRNSSPIGVV